MWWRRATDGKVNNEVLCNETFVAKGATAIFQTCLIVVSYSVCVKSGGNTQDEDVPSWRHFYY